MAILSTNQRLVKVGQEYSAGSGISIDDYVISVTGNVGGNTYSAGDNIDIYTQDNQLYISGKDWSNDIEQASANAYNAATAQIPAPQDLSYISAQVDSANAGVDYLSGVVITALPSDMATTGDIADLAQSVSETYQTKGDYLVRSDSANFYPADNPSGFISGIDLSNYYQKNETSGADELAQSFNNIPHGDEEVNTLVRSNSGEWNEVSSKLDVSVFQESSGLFLTAIPQEYVTESELPNYISAKLDTDVFASLSSNFLVASSLNGYATEQFVENVSGDITALIPTDYYPNTNPSGFISGVNLSSYYQKNETSSKEEISAAIANVPQGDPDVNNVVHNYSANGTWLVASDISNLASISLVEETSGTIVGLIPTDYYPNSNPSGFISGVDLSPYQTIEGMTAYQPAGSYATTNDLKQVSGDITAMIPSTAGLASESYVQNNSAVLTGMIDAKQDSLSFGYDEQNKISAINNSALAGGAISSYTLAYSHIIPPYGGYVIDKLNGSALSALESYSADRANYATNSNSSNSAGYAQTVNVTNVENLGFVRNLSSEYGTISVVRNNLIDSTNSAISRTGYEGFTSALSESENIGPIEYGGKVFSWNKSLPNTTFNCYANYPPPGTIIYYSANTNLTGEVALANVDQPTASISVPNATALNVWSNGWIQIRNVVASAADTFETVVGELAWASALPTYQYDSSNKISAINGSALAGGDMFTSYLEYNDQNQISGYAGSAFAGQGGGGNPEVENYVQSNSAQIDETVTSFQTNSSTYMVEPNLEFNAVGEISGYGNSAIAQYGAEKQWLTHDDTIVSISNSAQYAFGCNISALQRLMGIDETVLYNNTAATTADVAIGSTFEINEPITNFNKFKIYFSRFPVTSNGGSNGGPCSQIREYDSTACSSYFVINETFPTSTAQNPDWFDISMLIETISGTTWKCKACYQSKLPSGGLDRGWTYLKPYKVIGIGRISG